VEAGMAVYEWLQMQEPDFYGDRIFKVMPRWEKCTNAPGNYVENKLIILIC
jgi:hypothetical protein